MSATCTKISVCQPYDLCSLLIVVRTLIEIMMNNLTSFCRANTVPDVSVLFVASHPVCVEKTKRQNMPIDCKANSALELKDVKDVSQKIA